MDTEKKFQRKYKWSYVKLQVPYHCDVPVLQLALKSLLVRRSVRLDIARRVDLVCVDIGLMFVSEVIILSRHGE